MKETFSKNLYDKDNNQNDIDKMMYEQSLKDADIYQKIKKQNKVNVFQVLVENFREIKEAFTKGDIWVKLSAIFMGAGYFARKQIINGIIMMLVEVGFIAMVGFYSIPYLAKFSTLGTVQFESVFDPITLQNKVNNYDNSFLILLNSIISIFIIIVFILFYFANIKRVYRLQKMRAEGKHIKSFKEELISLKNEKFHITLLTLPVIGVVLMNIIPIFVLIAVAFTNYDQQHMPPNSLFTWVGWTNFKNLFSNSITITFGYAFGKILVWTLVWAIFATFTTFIGGILLAILINHKRVKYKKLWRTLFIISIAVPQFVTLLLVRNFFADSGIVNTICSNCGITRLLQDIGLVSRSIDFIPFLTSPGWAKFMIIMINIWVGVPYQMLVSTGILMNIPEDQIESARIDGANSWQIFWNIKIPHILFIQGPALITDFVKNINNFNVIWLLTQNVFITQDQALASSNAKEVDLLVTWLFRLTNEYYNYKMASVIGIVVFIICSVFTLITYTRTIKGDKEEDFR